MLYGSFGIQSLANALQFPARGFYQEESCAVSQGDISPTNGELGGRVFYAVSNPDSDGSYDDRYPQYDLALNGMQSY